MRRFRTIGVATLAAIGLTAGSVSAGTNSVPLDNGAELSATLDTPETGDTFLIQPPDATVDVPIAGTASIGEGAPSVHWTYVMDVSGSTGGPCGTANILACEQEAITNLNNEIVLDGSAVDVGVSVFGSFGAFGDMSPDGGEQPLAAPDSADVGVVVGSAAIGGLGQYTARTVATGTNFAAGLSASLVSVQASAGTSKNVVFLSDGVSNAGAAEFGVVLAALVGEGATIYSFAVGDGSSCTGGSAGTLQDMADATGGSCTEVPDPADLPDIVVNVTDTEMVNLQLTVDGVPNGISSLTQAVPFDGPGSTDFTATAANQAPGTHEVCFAAIGTGPKSDPASEQTVEVCETYDVFGFDLNPAVEVNELGMDNSHTVTATLVGAAGNIEGYPVDFAVSAGPNAGESGVCAPVACTTDADGNVTFTYSVPVEPESLGTDTISATVTVDDEQATLDVEKEWVDTTPPVSTCIESVNPAGKVPKAPGKGGQGQNQDGFYMIGATDDVWPDDSLQILVQDDETGTVFGPYPNGTVIKYVEANGATPSERSIGGPNSQVDVKIKGQGDASVFAIDGSGNESEGTSCLVPPAPK